jgi:hypothetical protein
MIVMVDFENDGIANVGVGGMMGVNGMFLTITTLAVKGKSRSKPYLGF